MATRREKGGRPNAYVEALHVAFWPAGPTAPGLRRAGAAGRAANTVLTDEAYPVDSGPPTYSVLSGGNRAATRTPFDGRCPLACPVPEGLLCRGGGVRLHV